MLLRRFYSWYDGRPSGDRFGFFIGALTIYLLIPFGLALFGVMTIETYGSVQFVQIALLCALTLDRFFWIKRGGR